MKKSESQNIEWKSSWRDEYLKWVCGFANASGGKIYIGVNDNGEVIGVKDAKKLMEDIPNKIGNFLNIIADENLLVEDKKEFIEVVVVPNTYPVSYKGEYFYRSGSTKQQLTGQSLNQFLLNRAGLTWDSVPIDDLEVTDFSDEGFNIFRHQAVKNKRMTEEDVNISNADLLDELQLIQNEKIKRAAALLFHQNPEKWIPGAFIKIGYFENDSELLYQDEVHGSLMSQADKTLDILYTKYFKAIISYEGVTRVETYPYPRAAIREALFNAIAHKSYGTLVPIQISVYEDRLYIANDCVFPEDWTVETLFKKHRSRPYNPLIASAFFRAGYIESWGRGIEKINSSCNSYGNDTPEYDVKSKEFIIMFKSLGGNPTQVPTQAPTQVKNISTQMGDLDNKILEAIQANSSLSQKEISEQLGVNLNTVKYHVNKLKKANIIKHEGTSQKGNWKII